MYAEHIYSSPSNVPWNILFIIPHTEFKVILYIYIYIEFKWFYQN